MSIEGDLGMLFILRAPVKLFSELFLINLELLQIALEIWTLQVKIIRLGGFPGLSDSLPGTAVVSLFFKVL